MAGERTVPLATLLRALADAEVTGDLQQPIESIETVSQAVRPGALFVAIEGTHADGHRYLGEAVANGARAVVVRAKHDVDAAGAAVVRVADTRRALSALAAAFYGHPSACLSVVGITGTNGKTTTAHMVAAILNEAGVACGLIGTVGAEFRSRSWQLSNTTPLPPELQRLLASMRDDGARAVAMEVSSHALALERVADVRFAIAALTNVTRDHLDFHQTLEAYAEAKRRLFALAGTCAINLDDAYGARWAPELAREGREVITYATARNAAFVAEDVVLRSDGSSFTVGKRSYTLNLPGRFNVSNALAAIAVTTRLGADDAAIARGLASLERVPGRMEHFRGDGVDVVVDYAHTPDALEQALQTLRETAKGSVAVVFGCGGERDAGKRSQMGAVAGRLADRVYVTNDNPRGEPPDAIANAIVSGIGARQHVVELDRRRAIERAIREACDGDVVLVAGKGHEGYQVVADRVVPFDDAAVARAALSLREGKR